MGNNDWKYLRHFNSHEFSDPDRMRLDFLQKLDLARSIADIPFIINSSYRDDDIHSAHATGRAVDIACTDSYTRINIVEALLKVGFSRIGVYPRHVHVDGDRQKPQNVLWLGDYSA